MVRQVTKAQGAYLDAMRDQLGGGEVGEERVRSLIGSDERAGRRMERWDQDGLGPLSKNDLAGVAGHYLTLAELSGRGVPADMTAVRLARHGRPCRRLGDVLRAEYRRAESELGLTYSEAVTDPYGKDQEITERVGEQWTIEMESSSSIVGRLTRSLTRGRSESVDAASLLGDLAALLFGGMPIKPQLVGEMIGLPGSAFEPRADDPAPWKEEPVTSLFARSKAAIDQDLAGVTAMTPVCENLLRFILDRVDMEITDDEIGRVAVFTAPLCLSLLAPAVSVLDAMREQGLTRADVSFSQFMKAGMSQPFPLKRTESQTTELNEALGRGFVAITDQEGTLSD